MDSILDNRYIRGGAERTVTPWVIYRGWTPTVEAQLRLVYCERFDDVQFANSLLQSWRDLSIDGACSVSL